MHALSQAYQPLNRQVLRPDWFELHAVELDIDTLVPAELTVVHDRIAALLDEIRALPRNKEDYGMIHGDFNDGNFTVDYSNGNITVFDFDDCCTFWFAYELASAWEGGIGRVMFRELEERRRFMEDYMGQVMAGYTRQNRLSEYSLDLIPIFIKLIQVQEFLYFVKYFRNGDDEIQSELNYKISCIEHDLPYMGFFDEIYSQDHPFMI